MPGGADWTMLHRIRSWPTNNGNGPPVALAIWRAPDGGIFLGITHGSTQILMAIPPEERAALAVAILAGGPRMEPST